MPTPYSKRMTALVESFITAEEQFWCEEDQLQELLPIKAPNQYRYTVAEAIGYLWILQLQWEQEHGLEKQDTAKQYAIAREINGINSSLQIYFQLEELDFEMAFDQFGIVCRNEHKAEFRMEYSDELLQMLATIREEEWRAFMEKQSELPPVAREVAGEWLEHGPPTLEPTDTTFVTFRNRKPLTQIN